MAMTKAEKMDLEFERDFNEMILKENRMLTAAIKKTIKLNLHLADGDDCTLIYLKKAIEKPKAKKVVLKPKVVAIKPKQTKKVKK